MKTILRLLAILALPLVLTGCFLVPGLFTSNVDLRKDGTFAFAYAGEIIFQTPDEAMRDAKPEAWSDNKANCSGPVPGAKPTADGAEASSDESRPCTRSEIAAKKKDWDAEQKAAAEKKLKDSQQFAALFGYNPSDDAANQKFAAQLMKYDGWKSVVYKGKGVFLVDYQITGKLGYDFIFPTFPQGDFIIPFVQLRKRDQGSVAITAPALIGGGLKGLASKMKALGAPETGDMPQSSRTKGVLTLTTDGEILTNNTENGPTRVPVGRSLSWSIDTSSEKVPEALIRVQWRFIRRSAASRAFHRHGRGRSLSLLHRSGRALAYHRVPV